MPPDEDGLPLIGEPIFRRLLVLQGTVAQVSEKRGTLVGWHNRERGEPVIEYPDGSQETLRNEEWS